MQNDLLVKLFNNTAYAVGLVSYRDGKTIINVSRSGFGRRWFIVCLKDRTLEFSSRQENQEKISARNKSH